MLAGLRRPPPVSPVPCVLVLPGTLFLVLSSDSRLSLPGVLFVLRVAHSHEVADLPASLPATASPLAPLSCPSFCDAPLTDLGALRAGVRHTRGRAALRSKLPTASRGPWAALQALGSSAAWASRPSRSVSAASPSSPCVYSVTCLHFSPANCAVGASFPLSVTSSLISHLISSIFFFFFFKPKRRHLGKPCRISLPTSGPCTPFSHCSGSSHDPFTHLSALGVQVNVEQTHLNSIYVPSNST